MSSKANAPAKSTGPQSSADLVAVIEKHDLHLFKPSNYRFDRSALAVPDDFFESTLSDVKSASVTLSERVRHLNDAPLMTKKMREAEESAKMSRFHRVMIRVLFPDRYSLQGVFEPKSTILEVTNFVKTCLREDVKFHLFVVPPKTVLKNMRGTLWSEKMVPAAQIYLGIDEGSSETKQLLKESVFTLAEDAPPPKPIIQAVPPAPTGSVSGTAETPTKPSSAKSKGKSIPKWFKRK